MAAQPTLGGLPAELRIQIFEVALEHHVGICRPDCKADKQQ